MRENQDLPEGTGNEKETAVKLFERDHSPARKSSSEEDEDCTGSDAGAEDGFAGALARDTGTTDILGRVVF